MRARLTHCPHINIDTAETQAVTRMKTSPPIAANLVADFFSRGSSRSAIAARISLLRFFRTRHFPLVAASGVGVFPLLKTSSVRNGSRVGLWDCRFPPDAPWSKLSAV